MYVKGRYPFLTRLTQPSSCKEILIIHGVTDLSYKHKIIYISIHIDLHVTEYYSNLTCLVYLDKKTWQ